MMMPGTPSPESQGPVWTKAGRGSRAGPGDEGRGASWGVRGHAPPALTSPPPPPALVKAEMEAKLGLRIVQTGVGQVRPNERP